VIDSLVKTSPHLALTADGEVFAVKTSSQGAEYMPTIQDAVQAAAPGDIIKIPPGVYDGADLVLPSNITLQADGNATIVGNLTINGSNTTVQGFTFNGGTVDVANSHSATIRDCVFNDCVPHSDNGSAIALNDASGVVIENNEFNRCQGVTLGNYNYDRVTIDHNTFTDCSQVLSLDSFSPASGNDIKFTNNYVSGEGRGGIETGGDGQYLTNLLVDGNTFTNLKGPAEIGPISVVARGDVSGTMITNNYCERGPLYDNNTPDKFSQAIEIFGPATVSGNTIVDFSSAFGVYGSGASIAGNNVFNTPVDIMGSEVLATRPTTPLLPADTTAPTVTPPDPSPADPSGQTADQGAGGQSADAGTGTPTDGTTAPQDVPPAQASDHSTDGQAVDASANGTPTDGTTAQQDVPPTQAADHSTDGQSVDASGNGAPTDGTTAQQDDPPLQSSDGHATVSFHGATEPDAALTATDAASLEVEYQSGIDQHHSQSINFDIGGSAALDENSISLRDHALVDLEAANPNLKVGFTVTAQPTGLDANALNVLKSAINDGVHIDAVKILIQDPGQSADHSQAGLVSAATAAQHQLSDLGLDAKVGFAWDANSAGAQAHDAHGAPADAGGTVPQPFEFSGIHHHDHIG
jgi:hypothetical protein